MLVLQERHQEHVVFASDDQDALADVTPRPASINPPGDSRQRLQRRRGLGLANGFPVSIGSPVPEVREVRVISCQQPVFVSLGRRPRSSEFLQRWRFTAGPELHRHYPGDGAVFEPAVGQVAQLPQDANVFLGIPAIVPDGRQARVAPADSPSGRYRKECGLVNPPRRSSGNGGHVRARSAFDRYPSWLSPFRPGTRSRSDMGCCVRSKSRESLRGSCNSFPRRVVTVPLWQAAPGNQASDTSRTGGD